MRNQSLKNKKEDAFSIMIPKVSSSIMGFCYSISDS